LPESGSAVNAFDFINATMSGCRTSHARPFERHLVAGSNGRRSRVPRMAWAFTNNRSVGEAAPAGRPNKGRGVFDAEDPMPLVPAHSAIAG